MKSNKLRTIIPLVLLLIAGVAFAFNLSVGTLSSIGWEDISVLCPLGALGTMLASKTLVPRALISLVFAVVGIILLGRFFCGWICPVPIMSKLRTLFKPQDEREEPAPVDTKKPLSEKELKTLKTACGGSCSVSAPADSRHLVLGGALLSAAIFGFPVFCLICPIGLSFAFVFVLIMMFGTGDVSWSVVAIPALLLVEVVFFRKWCSHICPLSSLMSLIGKANRTFRPSIDDSRCLETSRGVSCGHCATVCEAAIDPRHPEQGASWSECTKCRACVDNCPGDAITMPFLPKKSTGAPAGEAPAACTSEE